MKCARASPNIFQPNSLLQGGSGSEYYCIPSVGPGKILIKIRATERDAVAESFPQLIVRSFVNRLNNSYCVDASPWALGVDPNAGARRNIGSPSAQLNGLYACNHVVTMLGKKRD
jgi:hypothetical protein